jgi:cytochrome b involved in lipid metabolism
MSLSAEEVAKHASKTDCWVVVGEEVLDVTEFMEDHPGGSKAIMMFAGRDATEEFDMLHERKVASLYAIEVAAAHVCVCAASWAEPGFTEVVRTG